MKFIAIDFETADYKRDSACAIGIVKVENNIIKKRIHFLIRPPREEMIFSYLHGIYWNDVKNQPTFKELWPDIKHYFNNIDFIAAHNASFDKSVLRACCESAGFELPDTEFRCTMKLSRELWNIHPTKLNNVCDHFNIQLDHHNVVSDTDACAQIMMKALQDKDEPRAENVQKVNINNDSGIRMWSLGSSSGGNSTLIWDDEKTIMIDCGFSRLYMNEQLSRIGKKLDDIDAVLITHIHSDHINQALLNKFIKDKIPLYCHINLVNDLKKKFESARRLNKIGMLQLITDAPFDIGNFRINAFGVPHDSNGGCFGYKIISDTPAGKKQISMATDIGYVYENMEEHFLDSDILMVESNHDVDMLDNSRRSEVLKSRIKEIGHLSNEECSEFLQTILSNSSKLPSVIFLSHISKECNTRDLALEINKNYLAKKGFEKLNIIPLLPSPMENVYNL